MSGVSVYFCNLISDAVRNGATLPTTAYVALTTAEPFQYSTGSTIVEPPAGVGYSRQQYNLTSGNWTQASTGASRNVSAITFTSGATGIWGNIVCWALCTASSGGNLLFWGTLDNGIYVNTGAAVTIPIGAMEYSIEPPSTSTIG